MGSSFVKARPVGAPGARPTDPLWGERLDARPARRVRLGGFGLVLAEHGIEDVCWQGLPLVPRIFFSLRDMRWESIEVRWSDVGPVAGCADPSVELAGEVAGCDVELRGSIRLRRGELLVDYLLAIRAPVRLARAAPCVLHAIPPPGTLLAHDGPGRDWAVPEEIVPVPPISGYRRLSYPNGALEVGVELTGGVYELEDQRNWADGTLKSYSPPLFMPRPLPLEVGSAHAFALRLRAGRRAGATAARRAPRSTRTLALDAPPLDAAAARGPLPAIGLLHPGGAIPDEWLDRVAEAHPAFLHLLVELASSRWREELELELDTCRRLGATAVLTVDCPSDRRAALSELADFAGLVDTALLFDHRSAVTSDELARAGREALAGSSIRVGGGSRGHFASLNARGRVPDALEVVALSISGAAHDADRRALRNGLSSYASIVAQLARMAAGRELYLGPVGLAPTFDSWSAPASMQAPRPAWNRVHARDGSVLAAAWLLAAVARLTAIGVPRICAGALAGAAGLGVATRDGFVPTPRLALLGWLAEQSGDSVTAWSCGDSVAALAGSSTLVALMGDEPVALEPPRGTGRATILGAAGKEELDLAVSAGMRGPVVRSPAVLRLPGDLPPGVRER